MNATTPPNKEHLADEVSRCMAANDVRQALIASQRLTSSFPDYPYGWYLASFVLKKMRRYDEALKAIDRALQLSWSDRYQLHRVKCLHEAGDASGASAAIALIKDKTFSDPMLHNELGSMLHFMGGHAQALAHYSKAIALDGSNAEFHFNQAALMRYLGDSAGAEAAFDAAIALKPDEYEAYNGRAQLRTQTRERNHIAQLQATLERTRNTAGQVQLYFALAKEQEDVGDHAGAFESLSRGSDLKRRHMQYAVNTDVQIIDTIRATFGEAMFRGQLDGCPLADPIFVFGMPRTGTTLVERILGSHSQVHAAGELNTFSLELMRLVKTTFPAPPVSRMDFVAMTARLDFRALGEAYLAGTRSAREEAPRFIDKLPFNYLYAGLIHLALPKAKIVSVKRHPMDTCFAVYKQWFKDAYPFSYNLDELGQYYLAYHRLIEHWNAVMPGVMHNLSYEAVVVDIEGEARRLLQYCGLPWEDQCLRFYENPQASTTASALQVRQPVYASSVGKWRHYEQQLEPLRIQLENAGISCA